LTFEEFPFVGDLIINLNVISPHDYSFFLVKEKYLLVIVSVLYRDEIFSLGERIFFEVNSENSR
jgi:hypothetical protein